MIVCPSCGRPPVAPSRVPDPRVFQFRNRDVNPPTVCPCDSLCVEMFVHGALGTCFSWHVTGDGFRMITMSTPKGISRVSVYTKKGGYVGGLERMPDWMDAACVVAAMLVIDS